MKIKNKEINYLDLIQITQQQIDFEDIQKNQEDNSKMNIDGNNHFEQLF